MDKVREALETLKECITDIQHGECSYRGFAVSHPIAVCKIDDAIDFLTEALSQSEGWMPATEDDLPRPQVTYADHSYPAYSKKQMLDFANGRSAIRGVRPIEEPLKGDKANLAGRSNSPESRLTIDELRQWAKYIVYKRDPWDKDHACEQCGGQIVAEGFACAYHQAEAFLRASQGNGGRDDQ